MKINGFVSAAIVAMAMGVLTPAMAADPAFNVRLFAGSSWQTRNDVQIPNSDQGTRFSLEEAVGEGPINSVRFEVNWQFNERHGARLLLAPLSYTESVSFAQPVRFAGSSFDADQSTDATYRFNSWRLGYHYLLKSTPASSIRIGATLKVRDAEIRLEQAGVESSDDDVGLVPLLYLAGDYRLTPRWTFGADLDGLAGGPGRAIDLGLLLDYSINERWKVGAQLRVLDGGADTDDVYNFARFNSAAIGVVASF